MLRILCVAALALVPATVVAQPDDRYPHVAGARSKSAICANPQTDRNACKRKLRHHLAAYPAGFSSGIAATAQMYIGRNPTGMRRRWCGAFLRVVVRQSGLPDHPGGNLARNWASYGRPAAPGAVGAIAVMRSHVGIVTGRCGDGRIQVLSGNHNRTTGYGCYPAGRVIAWRAPG